MKWIWAFVFIGLLVSLTACDNKQMSAEVQQPLNQATTLLSKLQKSNAKKQFPTQYQAVMTSYGTAKRLAKQKKHEKRCKNSCKIKSEIVKFENCGCTQNRQIEGGC